MCIHFTARRDFFWNTFRLLDIIFVVCQYESSQHISGLWQRKWRLTTMACHCAWFHKSKKRWPRLNANGGGENGRVSPVSVLFFKPRQLLFLLQAHNFMPLKVPREKDWGKKEWMGVGSKVKAVVGVFYILFPSCLIPRHFCAGNFWHFLKA